jgi:hypothetical protein
MLRFLLFVLLTLTLAHGSAALAGSDDSRSSDPSRADPPRAGLLAHSDDPILIPPLAFVAEITGVGTTDDGERVWFVTVWRLMASGEVQVDGYVEVPLDDLELLVDVLVNPGADDPPEAEGGKETHDPVGPSVKGRLRCRKCSNKACCGDELTVCGNEYRYIRRLGQFICNKKCSGDPSETTCP